MSPILYNALNINIVDNNRGIEVENSFFEQHSQNCKTFHSNFSNYYLNFAHYCLSLLNLNKFKYNFYFNYVKLSLCKKNVSTKLQQIL